MLILILNLKASPTLIHKISAVSFMKQKNSLFFPFGIISFLTKPNYLCKSLNIYGSSTLTLMLCIFFENIDGLLVLKCVFKCLVSFDVQFGPGHIQT